MRQANASRVVIEVEIGREAKLSERERTKCARNEIKYQICNKHFYSHMKQKNVDL